MVKDLSNMRSVEKRNEMTNLKGNLSRCSILLKGFASQSSWLILVTFKPQSSMQN